MDEMRTGTRTELKRRWTPGGHRPVCKVKLGYEYSYLYAALAPVSGVLIALLLPDMTGECFKLFFQFFEKEVEELFAKGKILLLLDQASTHQLRIAKGCRIVLHHLPVASPELNSAERFFEEIRKPLSNRIFQTIEDVEEFLCGALKKYYQTPKLIIKLCHYPYMLYAKPK